MRNRVWFGRGVLRGGWRNALGFFVGSLRRGTWGSYCNLVRWHWCSEELLYLGAYPSDAWGRPARPAVLKSLTWAGESRAEVELQRQGSGSVGGGGVGSFWGRPVWGSALHTGPQLGEAPLNAPSNLPIAGSRQSHRDLLSTNRSGCNCHGHDWQKWRKWSMDRATISLFCDDTGI